jgi:hypothetical protein
MTTLRWLGFALGAAFVFFGILVLSKESVGERASLLAAISLIGTGIYFVNYALTGRSTLWNRRRPDIAARQESDMTTFETDGFLSDEMPSLEAPAEERYAEKFELAADANRLAHGLIYSVQVQNEHLPDILLATLLTRQTASFQSFYLLLKKGLFFQSQILLRNVAENMFIIGASRKDPEFVDKFVLSEEVTRKKSLDALVRDEQSRGNDIDQDVIDLIASLEEKIEREGATTYRTERIAQIAELSSYYDTLYRLTSMSVHTSSRGLDSALETDDDGRIVSITYEPIFDGLDMYIDYGISMMLYSLHEIASHFEQPVTEIEALQGRNQELAGPTE